MERSELAKGYEYAKNQYVLVENGEIKKVAPASTQTMEILQFVKLQEVDPLYYDMSYFAVPEQPGRKAYQLLVETMDRTGFAGLAKVAMHQREYTVVVRAREHGAAHNLLPGRNPPGGRVRRDRGHRGQAEEGKLAEQVLKSLAAPFEPQKFRDEFQHRVQELIEAKLEGHPVVRAEPPRRLAPVVDLMESLKKSLAAPPKKAPASETTVRKRAGKKASRKAA